jgi:hypothetical protein
MRNGSAPNKPNGMYWTLLTEVDIPNPNGALSPGFYCTIELQFPRKKPTFSVPADALIFNRDGMQVAVTFETEVRRTIGTAYVRVSLGTELHSEFASALRQLL